MHTFYRSCTADLRCNKNINLESYLISGTSFLEQKPHFGIEGLFPDPGSIPYLPHQVSQHPRAVHGRGGWDVGRRGGR